MQGHERDGGWREFQRQFRGGEPLAGERCERALAVHVLHSGLLPAHAEGDAAHIALATVHQMDILLTWNYRHIANAAIVGRLRRLAETQGHTLPEIYTPEELLGE